VSLILPPKVQFDLEREAWAEQQEEWAKKFSKELQGLDRRLSLVWIKDSAPEYGGLVPGRWHVRRKNDRGPDSYMAITGPDGEYMEPTSRIFDQLQQADLWRGDVKHKLWKERTEAAKQKAKNLEAAQAGARRGACPARQGG
jgi:hypothetical protein